MTDTSVSPNPEYRKGPEDLSSIAGLIIDLLVFLGPTALLGGLGLMFGNAYSAVGLAILWPGLVLAASLRFRRKRTFLVVERFGFFWDIKFAGPRLVIPWIDNIVLEEDFLQKQVPLFNMSAGQANPVEIDFIGASTPVYARAWYQIGDPDDLDGGRWDKVRDQVLKYTYRVKAEERDSRVAEIFENQFRPRLEVKTLLQAQAEMNQIAADSVNDARGSLAQLGVYPFPGKGITVKDLDLPQILIELRERELRGEADAKEAINRSRSYWEPVRQMKDGLAQGPNPIMLTDEQAINLFLAQKGFETLQKTGSNVSLVSADIGGTLKTITVGSTNQPRPAQGDNG
ncbi:MAG TPA: hypothetical protein VMT80_01055 [Candidatus Paceibacterota bacterium]|nr:hypothetical protein [Candidatus Paceibacterota bacterium]